MSPDKAIPLKVAIVGGGLVGATMAAALSKIVKQVIVVDRAPLARACQSPHVIALSHGTVGLLKQWLPNLALASKATEMTVVHTSVQGAIGSMQFTANQHQLPWLGLDISIGHIMESLLAERDPQNCQWLDEHRCTNIAEHTDHCTLTIVDNQESESQLTADLCLIADGGAAGLPNQMAMTPQVHDYHQQAIVGQCAPQRPAGKTAYERFTPQGAMALLPDGQNYWYVITTDESEAEKLMAQSEEAFVSTLNTTMAYRAGFMTQVMSRRSVPLKQSVLSGVSGHRILVMGNAAHSLHPIAAQGFNLSLVDCHLLLSGLQSLDTPTQVPEILEQFVTQSQSYQNKIIEGVHLLAMLGSHTWSTPIKSLMVGATGLSQSLKTHIAQWALGLNAPAALGKVHD